MMRMKFLQKLFPVVLMVGIASSLDIAREEHEEEHGENREVRREGHREENSGISSQVRNDVYVDECGSCHLAFQPQFLPKRSWVKIMNTLDDHFDENAALDDTTQSLILEFLLSFSAETSSSKMSRKLLSSISDAETPLRISETPYFKRKHHKIRPEVFTRKSIVSTANCAACHPKAENGDYEEDDVIIPKI
jgi:hypothetical protein